jgi:NAD+ synthase (glutamine-hydrolysing)
MNKSSNEDIISYPHFRRFAVLTPKVSIGNISYNAKEILGLYKKAVQDNTLLAITPELSLSSYSLADGFGFNSLKNKVDSELLNLAEATKGQPTCLVVGAPLEFRGKLFNCAVVMAGGEIVGVVPKQYLANYNEFYEQRWFTSGKDLIDQEIKISSLAVPFGTNQIFEVGDVKIGIEICEDLWVADPPSRKLAEAGAEVICNLSSSTEIVGKGEIRRTLISQTADRLLCGYVYSSSDPSESTADVIMSGHAIISEFDWIIAERQPLSKDKRILVGDIDIAHIRHERKNNQSWMASYDEQFCTRDCHILMPLNPCPTNRSIDPRPFVPSDQDERQKVTSHILNIQAHGLKKRLEVIKANGSYPKIVIGLSGGLDSTLALLVAAKTCDLLKMPRSDIHTITMPALSSSARTQDNATLLANSIGSTHEVISIQNLVKGQLDALGHDGQSQDITYENTQARTRTELLFNRANQVGGLVLGTGDLSELALGWCTFNGDHMSNYAVNSGIPKTLVKYIVETASLSDEFMSAKNVLKDILATPISPELTGDGKLSQETEDIIGPYELHDFFIYHLLRWGASQSEILALAQLAFDGSYKTTDIEKWLMVFCNRFVTQQFKRNAIPDGVKVGRVSLSPRGDLRFPSDADLKILLST